MHFYSPSLDFFCFVFSFSTVFLPKPLVVIILLQPGARMTGGMEEFECVFQCMLWANCTQFQKKAGLLGRVEWALTASPFIALPSPSSSHIKGVWGWGGGGGGGEWWWGGAPHYLSSQATDKVPGESGCVSDLMSCRRSAPRALSNFRSVRIKQR